jgi:hypothetical protein
VVHALDARPWDSVVSRRRSRPAPDPCRGYLENPTVRGVGHWGRPNVTQAVLMDLTSFLRGGPRTYRDVSRAFPTLYEDQIRAALKAVSAVRTGNTSRTPYSL